LISEMDELGFTSSFFGRAWMECACIFCVTDEDYSQLEASKEWGDPTVTPLVDSDVPKDVP
jgi:hypothetical protein